MELHITIIIIEIILILLGLYSIYVNFNNPDKRRHIYAEIGLVIMLTILVIINLLRFQMIKIWVLKKKV